MTKKRGFTLVEVLVVIAISAIIMTAIGTTFVFVATSSGDLIHKSEELMEVQNIETYLRGLIKDASQDEITEKLKDVKLDKDNNNSIVDGDETIIDNTELKDFKIETEEAEEAEVGELYFVKCTLTYENAEYVFTLGISSQEFSSTENGGE